MQQHPVLSTQENKAIARQFSDETWSKGNLAAVDEFASPDFKVHYSSWGLLDLQ